MGKQKTKPKTAGLSETDEIAKRRRARRYVPSEPWVDAQFPESSAIIDGDETRIVMYAPRAFPPGGSATRMIACPGCVAHEIRQRAAELLSARRLTSDQAKAQAAIDVAGQRQRLHPPSVTGKPLCLDHAPIASQEAWGRSPSAVAIEFLQNQNLPSREIELAKESRAALRREIKRHEQRRRDAVPVLP